MAAISTFLAVCVALATPWIINWLTNRPKKSKLVFVQTNVIDQSPDPNIFDFLDGTPLNIGRLVIRNDGRYIAENVEAYIDRIKYNGEFRANYIPMPLRWTHGELNKEGSTMRNIYPHQTVYLDIFDHVVDESYVGNTSVIFSVLSGRNVDDLSKMNIGRSELYIKLYQASGQVDEICILAEAVTGEPPQISIKT